MAHRLGRRNEARAAGPVLALVLLLSLSGCGWVSNRWQSMFGSGQDPGLIGAPEGERQRLGEPPPKTAPLAKVEVSASDLPQSEDETRRRVALLDKQLAAMRAELDNVKPSIDRLVKMEGDIRQLVIRLSQLSNAPQVAPPKAQAAPPSTAPPPTAAKPAQPVEMKPQPKAPTGAPPATPAAPAPAQISNAPDRDPMFADTQQFGAHLASYRSESRAAEGWRTYRRNLQPLLNDLQARVLALDFNDGRGMFYRLKAGPFADRGAAQKFCDGLRERGEYCKVEDFTGSALTQVVSAR